MVISLQTPSLIDHQSGPAINQSSTEENFNVSETSTGQRSMLHAVMETSPSLGKSDLNQG